MKSFVCDSSRVDLFTPARAQDPRARDQNVALFGLPSRQHLFGDRGGGRTALAEKGIIFHFFYITDLEANPAGRLRQAQTGWERIRGTVDNNFGRLISWQRLRADAGSNRKLDLTVGFDYSPGDVSRENVQVTAGGHCNAPFASRKNDRVGFAVVYNKISDSFSNIRTLLGAPQLGTEKAIELNYSLQVTPYW